MKAVRRALVCLLLIAAASPLALARVRDPLNAKEADQLREVKMEPNKRLPLMVKFARARLDEIELMGKDPRLALDRANKTRDLLEDFAAIVDELGDNIDDYATRDVDMRAGLKEVITNETEFQTKLKALKENAADPSRAAEARTYALMLESATDAVNSGLDLARQTMTEQERLAEKRKQEKKEAGKRH